MAPTSRETAAIVLDSRDHGESDKIITFYTRDFGRITGIAKGANKSKKRFLNKLELFTHVFLYYNEKPHSTLVFIVEAELISSYIEIRNKVERYIIASFIREILLLASTEGEGDSEIFQLLCWSLQALDTGNKTGLGICAIFLLRLFGHLGYRPDFSHCSICGIIFDVGQQYTFNQMNGGLVCSKCREKATGTTTLLSPGTIRILNSALTDSLDRLHRLQFSRQALNESLPMLHRFGRNLFQREIHAWRALRDLLK